MHASTVQETGEARGTRGVGFRRFDVVRPEWFTPRDANLLGRLKTGLPVTETELSEVPKEFQTIAVRIHDAPLTDRQAITDEWLRGCLDAEAIKQTVIHTDLTQPHPLATGPEEAAARAMGLDVPMTRTSEIVPSPADWLWRGREPLGTITLFSVDPKRGKS